MFYEIIQSTVLLGLAMYLYCTICLIYDCYKLRKFVGPIPLPIIGNLYESGSFSFLRFVSKLRKRYGKIFTFMALTKSHLVICDPVVVRRILSDSQSFIKGEDYTKYFSIVFGTSLVTSNGQKHRTDRGIFGKFFIKSYISNLLGTSNKIAIDAVQEFAASRANRASESCNIEEFFAILSLRTFGMLAMGVDYGLERELEKKICHTVSKGSLAVGQIVAFRPPVLNLIPQISYLRHVREFLGGELKRRVAERLEYMQDHEAPDDCLTAMIRENLSMEEMVDHFVTLISAGHDTTAFFSSYLSLLLAQHPAIQDKVYAEMAEVLGDKPIVSSEDCAKLTFFHKCMQETLRLYSIIPNITRVAEKDVYIKEANITIPKNITILIPMFLINRDPELWENPSSFNPHRFDDKTTADFTSAKNGFFPFGYGSRTCIGNTMAQLESTIFFCHLLRKFRIEEQVGFKPNILSGISLTTSNGIHVKLVPR
jgi:cytochrome P450